MDIANVLNTLTGREVFQLEDLIAVPLHRAEEASQVKFMYALYFIVQRREDKNLKWNDVQDMTLTQVTEALGVEVPLAD